MAKHIDRDELIRTCRELVKIPSISGDEGRAVAFLEEKMKEMDFDEVHIDGYGSLLGKVEGRGGGRTVLLDGHIDTVGVGDPEAWTHDPFGAEIADGRIYGRGTSDMKAALSAMLHAAAFCVEERPEGDVYVSATVHEEMFEGVALQRILDSIDVDYVIIGEASELNLKTGQRGRAELKLTSHGKSCHSANPQHGVNAVYMAEPLIRALRKMKLPEDENLGRGILELTDIISKPYPGASVVPSECRITYDRRLVEGETAESVVSDMMSVIRGCMEKDAGISAELEITEGSADCYTGEGILASRLFPAWYYGPEEAFVQAALRALKGAGIPAKLDVYSFCTNGSTSAGILGIPTIGFGPSSENLAHVSDEYVEIEQLVTSADGYEALVRVLNAG